MSKHSAFSSTARGQIGSFWALACACLLLSGCPSASNPTQPQTPSVSSPSAPSSASSSSSGSSGTSASVGIPGIPGPPSVSSPSSGTDAEGQSDEGRSGSEDGDLSGGEGSSSDVGSQSDSGSSQEGQDGGSEEPGFGEDVVGSEALPDLSDEPSLEDISDTVANIPDIQDSTAGVDGPGVPGGQSTGSGNASTGTGGYGDWTGTGTSSGGGNSGPLTPAEQVAILDAELEKGAGEFDSMILETEAEQRRTAREQAPQQSSAPGGGNSDGSGSAGESPYGEDIADGGGYSTGGGMGGASRGGSMPSNTAKYPPPADIPSGSDDDVVARQLREAAMREPDPAVREKLWEEYRKYKGISP